MSIYFRGRRDGEYIDCSFFVRDGRDSANIDHYRKGDQVVLFFDVTPQMAEAINELGRDDVRAYGGGAVSGKPSVHIPFRIQDVRHTLSWQEVGTLRTLGSSYFLQAESGLWEDIFKWVCLRQVPEWADLEVETA